MRDKIADNTENTGKHGRRATDYINDEVVLSSTKGNRWGSVRDGLGLAFILGVAVTAGGFLKQVDSNVTKIDEHDKKFDIVVARLEAGDLERLSLLKSLEKSNEIEELRNQQQIKSDERFEGMFNESNKKLDDVIKGVNDNKIQIINLNKTTSIIDKTNVYLAMR
jgi:hypothetical protein